MNDMSGQFLNEISPSLKNQDIPKINGSDKTGNNSGNQDRLVEFQKRIIDSLIKSANDSSKAYQAAMELKESLLKVEFESQLSALRAQKNVILEDLGDCRDSLETAISERNKYQKLLENSKEQISQLKIERGAEAREVKRLILERKELTKIEEDLAIIDKKNRILVIERGRYARECKSLKIDKKELEIEVIQKNSTMNCLSVELERTNHRLSNITQQLDGIKCSKRYKLATLIANNSGNFFGLFSLLWKIPRFLLK